MRGVEGRPGQEAYQQFKAGLPGNCSGERSGSDQPKNEVISPLAANLVRLMEQARQAIERRGDTEFHPPFWMYDKISSIVNDYSPDWRRRVISRKESLQKEGINSDTINLRTELSDEELEERQYFFEDIQWVYGIAAYPQFTPRQKNVFREDLQGWQDVVDIRSVTLNEQQRTVLAQIASATHTPIDPDQEEYSFDTVLSQPEITKEEMRKDHRFYTW
jgi:hypothetical protein